MPTRHGALQDFEGSLRALLRAQECYKDQGNKRLRRLSLAAWHEHLHPLGSFRELGYSVLALIETLMWLLQCRLYAGMHARHCKSCAIETRLSALRNNSGLLRAHAALGRLDWLTLTLATDKYSLDCISMHFPFPGLPGRRTLRIVGVGSCYFNPFQADSPDQPPRPEHPSLRTLQGGLNNVLDKGEIWRHVHRG